MATIRRKGNGWEAAIERKGIRKSKTFPTKTLATHWAADKEKEIIGGKNVMAGKRTFGDLMQKYAAEVSPTKRGGAWEITRMNARCRDAIANIMLCDLSRSDLAKWRDERLNKVEGSTVRREMNLLNHALNIGMNEWEWITENPLKGVKRPPDNPARVRLISDDEIQRLLFALGYDVDIELKTISSRIGAVLLFAIETGMRSSEITDLTWKYIDFDKRTAHLPFPKNGIRRDVPLSPEAIRILKQVKSDGDSVFNMTSRQRDSLFRKAKKEAMIKDLHFHDSRHNALTALSKKLDILPLARMIGHKNLSELMTYYNEPASEMAKQLDADFK